MDQQKKKRGFNYTQDERLMVLNIISKYTHIVDCKVTSGETIRRKQNAWKEITKQYNAFATSGHRDWTQLRHLYENHKQRTKKKQEDIIVKTEYEVENENSYENDNNCEHENTSNGTKNMYQIEITNEAAVNNIKNIKSTNINNVRQPIKYTTIDYKNKYFKMKFENSKMEHQKLKKEIQHNNLKQKLEIYLLNLKIKRLKKFI